jgi:hypothetical protein
MAVRSIIVSGGNGIGYTKEVDSSADYPSIANETFFKDISLGIGGMILYKDSTGDILSIYSKAFTGTVTSVGLTMPAAFTVTNSPITSTGDLAVTGAGTVDQYVRGNGTLANFPSSTGGGSSLTFYLNGSVSQGTFGGVAFAEMDKTPILGAGTDFTINANGYIQSFITDANVPGLLEIPAGNWNFETYFSASSGGGTPSFYVELYKWDGATLSLIASSSANPEGITNGTSTDLYITALAVPQTTLLATDRLAVRIYVTHSGRTIKLHTEDSHLCEIITTFSTGLTALNGLTAQVQNLAVGTTGTDFAISSTGTTHTFNLPTASATNRGALSSGNWTDFNNKVDGSGTTNYISKFTTNGTTIGNSQIIDDGTTLSIGTSLVGNAKLNIYSNLVYGINTATDAVDGRALYGASSGAGNLTAGVYGVSTGTATINAGVYGTAVAPSGKKGVGVYSVVSGLGTKYSFVGQDGSQQAGRFLKSITNDGEANWANITTADVSGAVAATSGTNNYIAKFTPNGTTIGNSQIIDNGTQVYIGAGFASTKFSVNAGTSQTYAGYFNNENSTTNSTGIIVYARNANTSNFALRSTASGGVNAYGLYATISDSENSYGVYARASGTTKSIAGYFEAYGSNKYSLQLVDGTETVAGRFLKNVTTDGRANWATLVEADISNFGVYAKVGTYNNGYVPRWNAVTNTLQSSQIQDNGTTVGINSVPGPVTQITAVTTLNYGFSLENNSTSASAKIAFLGETKGVSAGQSFGISGYAEGSTHTNVGVKGNSSSSGTAKSIAGQFIAAGTTTGGKYSLQLQDGTHTTAGRFLKNMDIEGNANWASISVSDVSGAGTVTSVGLSLGTTGTDVNISNSPITSSGSINLNIPTASATARGLLSIADFNTFNNKVSAFSSPTSFVTRFIGTNQIAGGSIQDSGTSVSVGNATPSTSIKLLVVNTGAEDAIKGYTNSSGRVGVYGVNDGSGSGNNTGVLGEASGSSSNNAGVKGNGSSGTGTGIGVQGTGQGTGTSIGLSGIVLTGANKYAIQLKDGTEGSGKFLKCVNTNEGYANWASITAADVSGAVGVVSGSQNYLAKFTPNGTTIGNSLIQDDGTNLSVNTTIDVLYKFKSQTSDNDYALGGYNTKVSGVGVVGYSNGAGTQTGVAGIANNASATINTGISGSAVGGAIAIGIKAIATGASSVKYAAQLSDGTEEAGKFLKSIDNFGKANWAFITAANVSGVESTITAGTTSQYWRGDKTWQTLNTTAVAEGTNLYFTETRTIASILTGLSITGGNITSSDSVLVAFGKLQNQLSAVASPMIYQGTWNASTNSPTLTSSTGTKGHVYRVTTSGSTNIDGITDWKSGDFIVYNGTTWDKWDSTDAVTSVNGYTGVVTLVKADVGLSNVENTALSTWAGSTNITTLGTIGSGIWQGTAIADTYISSASTWNAKVGGSGTLNYLSKFTASGTIGNSTVFESGGNVGIGTVTLSEKLNVNGNASLISSTTTKINLESGAGVRTYLAADGQGSSFGSLSNHDVVFYRNNVEFARKTATGFGIGNNNPSVALDVTGEIAIRGNEDADDARMYFLAGDNSIRFRMETDLDADPQNDILGFRSFNTDNILILKGNGNVGIGTSTPLSTPNYINLTIGDNAANKTGLLKLRSTYNNGDGAELYQSPTGTTFFNVASNLSGYIIDNQGNMGIGSAINTLSPLSAKLHVNNIGTGNSFLVEDNTNPDSTPFVIDVNGNVGVGTLTPATVLHVRSTAVPSTGEEIARFDVSDNTNSYLRIYNSTVTDSSFTPTIEGKNSAATVALGFVGNATLDTGNEPVTIFDSRFESAAVVTRPLFQWNNFGATKMTMLANGNLGIGITPSSSYKLDVAGNTKVAATSGSEGLKVTIVSTGGVGGTTTGVGATASGSNSNYGAEFVAEGTAVQNVGILARAQNADVNIGGLFYALGTGSKYALQLQDGTQFAGKFLKSIDNDGKANWANISASDVSGAQASLSGTGFVKASGTTISYDNSTYAKVGTYTDSYVPRWNATTNTLVSGSIQDNGTTLAIGATPVSTAQFAVNTTAAKHAVTADTYYTGAGASYAFYGVIGGVRSSDANIAIRGEASNSTVENYGAYFYGAGAVTAGAYGLSANAANSGTGLSIGGRFVASGASTQKFSVELVDGTETVAGRFLKNIVSGRANWATLVEADISNLGIYAKVGTYTNGYIPRWNATTNTLASGVIQDNGITIGINQAPASDAMLSVSGTSSFGDVYQDYAIKAVNNPFGGSLAGVSGIGVSATNSFGSATGASISAAASYGNTAVGAYIVANSGSNNYALQLVDGTQTSGGGKFLKDVGDGKANWATLTESSISNFGTYAKVGTYTNGYVPRWNATINTLVSGIIQDNGSNVGIGKSPSTSYKLEVAGSIYGYGSGSGTFGITGENNGDSAGNYIGVKGSAAKDETPAVGNKYIGGWFYALGNNNNAYSVMLQDGTEDVAGRFLKNMDTSGRANWANITVADTGLTLTTIGSSGAATLVGNTLNIPQYSGGGGGSGTVTTVSVASANGFSGTVANATTTPAITLGTTVTGLLKGNGTTISAATAGVDYQMPISGTPDYVARFDGSGLLNTGLIRDNNTTTSINTALDATKMLAIKSSTEYGLYVETTSASAVHSAGFFEAKGSGSVTGGVSIGLKAYGYGARGGGLASNMGIYGYGYTSNDSTEAIGAYLYSNRNNGLGLSIGARIKADASGQPQSIRYAVQLKDGTETVAGGRFLIDKGDGKAQWEDLTIYNTPYNYGLAYALTQNVLL